MQYSDDAAHTLTFFEDTYTEIPVTAETYEAETGTQIEAANIWVHRRCAFCGFHR